MGCGVAIQPPSLLPHLLARGLLGLIIGALPGAFLGHLSTLGLAGGLVAGLLTGGIAGLALGYRQYRHVFRAVERKNARIADRMRQAIEEGERGSEE